MVFLSYATGDSALVEPWAAELETHDIPVFQDRRSIVPGDDYIDRINEALEGCRFLVLFWSSRSAASLWVEHEWHTAIHRRNRRESISILVASLDSTEPPALMAIFQRVSSPGALVAVLRRDQTVEDTTGHWVGGALRRSGDGSDLYVSSDLFAFVAPFTTPLNVPVSVFLDRVLRTMGFKRRVSVKEVVGIRVSYSLTMNNRKLRPAALLSDEGVHEGSLLTLVARAEAFGPDGVFGSARFRSANARDRASGLLEDVKAHLREEANNALTQAALLSAEVLCSTEPPNDH